MPIILIIFFGLIIGSFLNVVILRLHSGQSIAIGRSHCPACRQTLAVGDLIPVFSFLLLKGRCRYCRQKISWQYPAVEIATAILFLAAYWLVISHQPADSLAFGLELSKYWLAISALIVVFVYDLKWLLIPDEIVLPIGLIILLINLFSGRSFIDLSAGIAVGFGFFAVQYFVSRGRWIGGGDLRLGFFMGCLLGFYGTVLALFFAYIIGAIVAVLLLVAGRIKPKSQVPFGAFIVPAILLVIFFGSQIINFYLSLLL